MTSYLVLIVLTFFTSTSLADQNCSNHTSQISSIQKLQDRICKSNPEFCGKVELASWYENRSNEMTDAAEDDNTALAMATAFTKAGISQMVQVCEGVYLGTAHGILETPKGEIVTSDAPFDMFEGRGILAYPLNENQKMSVSSDEQIISPRKYGGEEVWNDPTTDYVFVKVDNPVRPKNYVSPLTMSNQKLIASANRGDFDVKLYRPKTIFQTDERNYPDFKKAPMGVWSPLEELKKVYDVPQVVSQRCQLAQSRTADKINFDCPTEPAVSGSPVVSTLNGKTYLIGMATTGGSEVDSSMQKEWENMEIPNAFLQSKHFCKDYEKACGVPCENTDISI